MAYVSYLALHENMIYIRTQMLSNINMVYIRTQILSNINMVYIRTQMLSSIYEEKWPITLRDRAMDYFLLI